MQRLLFVLFILFFLIVSCAKQKPNGVLSESTMTDLFMEVSLIDAYLNNLPIDSGRKVMPVLYNNLFKQFDIDSTQYLQNLDFYYGNPKLTEKIFTDVQKRLTDYDKTFQIEDSIRSVFVNDSIRRVSRIQQLDWERRNNTLDYHKDTTEYNYREATLKFYNRSNLHLQAYGFQTTAIPSLVEPTNFYQDPIMQDSVLRKYLDVPMYKLLINKPKDSTNVDFRFLHIYFLKKAGLNVRTGYSYAPVITSNNVSLPTDTTRLGIDTVVTAPNLQDVKPVEIVNEPINRPVIDNTVKPEKRLQGVKRLLKPVE